MHPFSFVSKVFFLSLAIALAIRYLAPGANIPATASMALIFVCLPTLIMAGLLSWKAWKTRSAPIAPDPH